ncbi:MAG: hypothetical protein ACYDGM_12670 [Vulcanimicrobiaceae bacterium]
MNGTSLSTRDNEMNDIDPLYVPFDPADPPMWALEVAVEICDEVYAESGDILKAEQVVYGLPGATPGFTHEDLT